MVRVIARMHSEYTHSPSGTIFTRENVVLDGLYLQVAVATVPDDVAREHFHGEQYLVTPIEADASTPTSGDATGPAVDARRADPTSTEPEPGAALPPSPAPSRPTLPEPGEPNTAAGASEDAHLPPKPTNRRTVRGR